MSKGFPDIYAKAIDGPPPDPWADAHDVRREVHLAEKLIYPMAPPEIGVDTSQPPRSEVGTQALDNLHMQAPDPTTRNDTLAPPKTDSQRLRSLE